MKWTHGKHSANYGELALRPDQADYAAWIMHRSATFLIAVMMESAIGKEVPNVVGKNPQPPFDPDLRSAYQIARIIRNSFAHAPFLPILPTWSIDADCRNKVFAVRDIISLDTTDLHGKVFKWQHYGGPLALLRLCQFVRFEILQDERKPRKTVPMPETEIYQIGDLILTKSKIPPDAKKIEPERLADGSILLPGGYVLGPPKSK
jgi:hypothetical protein